MVTLIVDRPLPLLTNAGSRRGFPRPKMAAVLTCLTSPNATDQTVNKHKTRDKHTQVIFLQLAFSHLGPSFPKASLRNDRR